MPLGVDGLPLGEYITSTDTTRAPSSLAILRLSVRVDVRNALRDI